VFDRQFFSSILPEHVRTTAAAHPGRVPVLEIHLVDRTILDLCHVVRLADGWVAVAYFCRADARVTLTMRDAGERRIGFDTTAEPIETPPSGQPAGIVVPHPTPTGDMNG
jgi:hypothetical protein